MPQQITGIISWLRTWFDGIYADKNQIDTIQSSINRIGSIEYLRDKIYPIGSLYFSANDVNPATLFGGTWERIEDRFLLSKGSKTLGSTGGEENHVLTVDELAQHRHDHTGHSHTPTEQHDFLSVLHSKKLKLSNTGHVMPAKGPLFIAFADEDIGLKEETSTNEVTVQENYVGMDKGHNNMPPYLVVNVWKRTA